MMHLPFAFWRFWLRRILAIMIAVLVVRTTLCERFHVTSDSMEPELNPGDFVFVDKQVYEWRNPRRWEVIVFRGPEYRTTPYIKRIVGLPGENIQIKDGRVFINGEMISTPIGTRYLSAGRHAIDAPRRLEVDEYFVLGDNDPKSNDSRHWPDPAVRRPAIIGRKLP
jgi:signal peptidase I